MVWEAARHAAIDLRERYGTSDPYALCRELGIDVYETNIPDGSSGMIVKRSGESAEIFVELDDVAPRRRFTVAHELGHYMERDLKGDTDFSFRDRRGMKHDIHEFFADEFAGELLMPEAEFRRLWEQGLSSAAIASRFNVSLLAVEKRRGRLQKHSSL